MWPDWVLNPGPLALESDALLTVLRGPAACVVGLKQICNLPLWLKVLLIISDF